MAKPGGSGRAGVGLVPLVVYVQKLARLVRMGKARGQRSDPASILYDYIDHMYAEQAGLDAEAFEAALAERTAELQAEYQAALWEVWNDAGFAAEQTARMQERVGRAASAAAEAYFRALWPLERKNAREALKGLAARLEAELPLDAEALRGQIDGALAEERRARRGVGRALEVGRRLRGDAHVAELHHV